MDTIEQLRQLHAYNAWANRETLDSMTSATAVPERALEIMAHIAGAERLWLQRLKHVEMPAPVWPQLTPEQCAGAFEELASQWQSYLQGLDAEQLAVPTTYVNSKGESWTNSIEEILLHLVMHSMYHRGQIALELRGAGQRPATTDYIHAVRQGIV